MRVTALALDRAWAAEALAWCPGETAARQPPNLTVEEVVEVPNDTYKYLYLYTLGGTSTALHTYLRVSPSIVAAC